MSNRTIIREYEDMRESDEVIVDALIKYGTAKNKEDGQRILKSVRQLRITEAGYRAKKKSEKQREAEFPGLTDWVKQQAKVLS
ncbi:hypothetical protein SCT_2642 [Sulfuricella sp. T08]|uniref:hypothetical protein n=1 Tax=Sulfuricella sp. T08 TaxID=1632857 RepID=UPI0006179755|nr:hypothetical protein [Sulfuricella sp. T08]GAO37224.1 hypothetical protein SCT_2642 [Sulfuricella sp. T08]